MIATRPQDNKEQPQDNKDDGSQLGLLANGHMQASLQASSLQASFNSDSEILKEPSTSSSSESISSSLTTTAILHNLLQQNEPANESTDAKHSLQSSRSKTLKIVKIDDQSFIKIKKEPKIEWPVLNIQESDLIFCSKEINEAIKKMLGVQESAHSPDIVTYNDGLCDIIFSPNFIHDLDFNTLPGKGRACYIFTPDENIYYANKIKKKCFPLPITPEKFDELFRQLKIQKPESSLENFEYIEVLTTEKLKIIIEITKNIHHGMGFYKKNKMASKLPKNGMIVQEAQVVGEVAGGTNYQVLAHDNFPDTYAVRNDNHYVGVFSEYLPGFTPNRDCRLQPTDLTLDQLKTMTKKRDADEIKRLENVMNILIKYHPLLERDADPEKSYIVQFAQSAKQTVQSCSLVAAEFGSYNVKRLLEKYVKYKPEIKKVDIVIDPAAIRFGELEDLRKLLLGRKKNITPPKESQTSNNKSWSLYGAVSSIVSSAITNATSLTKNEYKHPEEIEFIDQAISELNIILLDESALFMKHHHRISSELHNRWVDIETEIQNSNSKYKKIEIAEGLTIPLKISLTDILHYRNRCGLGKGLTDGQLNNDPDRNARNVSKNGLNVDAGQAFDNFTSRFEYSRIKKQPSEYELTPVNIIYFPNEYGSYVLHHPTKVDPASAATDTIISTSSGLTKNWYIPEDKINFGLLEDDPIFSFQKYVQHVICLLKTEKMNAAFAELHIPGNLQILNEEGDLNNPLPLVNELGVKQDYRTTWVKYVTAKSLEDERVCLTLLPLQKIIERQADFVLELVLEAYANFLEDKKAIMGEKHMEAYNRLAAAFDPAEIKQAFYVFRDKILSMNLEEKIEEKAGEKSSLQISMSK